MLTDCLFSFFTHFVLPLSIFLIIVKDLLIFLIEVLIVSLPISRGTQNILFYFVSLQLNSNSKAKSKFEISNKWNKVINREFANINQSWHLIINKNEKEEQFSFLLIFESGVLIFDVDLLILGS